MSHQKKKGTKQSNGKCPLQNERYYPTATRDVTHKQMDGISDLVVWAPIKEGFVDAFGNVTYESRLRIVTEALNKLRRNVREYQLLEPFADPTKRILSLLDFRIGIAERDLFGFGDPNSCNTETLRPRKYMYLTATFDGPWEPYMRQIWYPMGAFLDLILCNCEGYLPATRTSFEDYVQWVRDHSLDTGMFYLVMGQTVKDHIYLEDMERLERETLNSHDRDVLIAQHTVRNPDEDAAKTRAENPTEFLTLALEALNVLYQLTRYYPQNSANGNQANFLLSAAKQILQEEQLKKQFLGQSLKSYIETLAYPKKSPPCDCVHNNNCELCLRMKGMRLVLLQMKDQLEWYDQKIVEPRFQHPSTNNQPEDEQIQKGILSPYDQGRLRITSGATLLLKIKNPAKIHRLLDPDLWSWEGSEAIIYGNISVTNFGVNKLPLTEKERKAFPKEFREGMEARAPLMGDMHYNHPQNWPLPKRNGQIVDDDVVEKLPPVSMSEVDLIIQLRGASIAPDSFDGLDRISEMFIDFAKSFPDDTSGFSTFGDFKGILQDSSLDQIKSLLANDNNSEWVSQLFGWPVAFGSKSDSFKAIFSAIEAEFQNRLSVKSDNLPLVELVDVVTKLIQNFQGYLGVELLSIESSSRSGVVNSSDNRPKTIDHFGYEDGISQPILSDVEYHNQDSVEKSKPMEVARGDLIYGFSNLLGDTPPNNTDKAIQYNGSFLAIRKIKQDVEAFETFLDKYSECPADKNLLAAKLMGRFQDGRPLIPSPNSEKKYGEKYENDFNYENDINGLKCPFASHIRRANPRELIHRQKTPKILRRGMSFGKRFDEDPCGERGVLFMAYCSNLAEQYEVIQRWVNGGNSSHVASGQTDPIMAPRPRNGKQVVKYAEQISDSKNDIDEIRVRRLEKTPEKPFTSLEWGIYAFVPAKKALHTIYKRLKSSQHDVNNISRYRGYDKKSDLLNRIERGKSIVKDIEAMDNVELQRHHWKVIFEDYLTKDPSERDVSNDVWAYITEQCNGIYRIESGVEGHSASVSENPVILITDKVKIQKAWSDYKRFSNKEIGDRITGLFAEHYIGKDPDVSGNICPGGYHDEAIITNKVLLDYKAKPAYELGYTVGKEILDSRKKFTQTIFKKDTFKIELSREYFAPALAKLCEKWFGITTDIRIDDSLKQFFESGAFDPDLNQNKKRLARCPGDFLAPSRSSFYPRPTNSIWNYGRDHGNRLKSAIDKLTSYWRKYNTSSGVLTESIIHKMMKGQPIGQATDQQLDLLGRNIIGTMIGMLPSSEASLRGAIFEWVDQDMLWRIQGDIIDKTGGNGLCYDDAKSLIIPHLKRSMSKRPAPDLLHRIVTYEGEFEGVKHNVGDTVFLSLVAAMMKDLEYGNEDGGYLTVFGGKRTQADATTGENPHACPATKMAMGYLSGILAALLESGRIMAMPASLIFEIGNWSVPKDKEEVC